MSFLVQSQISTSKPSSAIRRTRSTNGRSTNTISARDGQPVGLPVSRVTSPPPSIRTGRPARTDSAAARAIASAARASSPVDRRRACRRARRRRTRPARRCRRRRSSSWSLRTVSTSSPGGAGEHHAGAAAVAHGGHAARAEHLAAHVVAVGRLEAGLGRRRWRRCRTAPTTTAVSSRPASCQSGSTSASAVAYTSTASAPGLRNRSASKSWIRVSLKIVSGAHAAPGRSRPGRGSPTAAAAACRAVPSSSRARAAAQSAANRRLKPTCSTHPGRAGGVDRPVGVGQGQRHRLLAEHALAGRGGGDDQVGVEPGRRGDHHRVDLPGRRRPPPGRCTPRPPPASAASRSAAPGAGSATAASRAPGSRRASVSPWIGAHPARPDQGHPYRIRPGHRSPRCSTRTL